MKIIRQNMFETNSSSTHSLTLKLKGKNEKWKTEEEVRALDGGDRIKDVVIFEYIYREIRSKIAKACIIYQLFINYYTERKNYIFGALNEEYNIPYRSEDYEPYEAFSLSLDDALDLNSFNKNELKDEMFESYNNYLEELEMLDIKKKNISEFLINYFVGEEKEDFLFEKEKIEKLPLHDETSIGNYFSNSLLDSYSTAVDYLSYILFVKRNSHLNTNNDVELIKHYLEEDYYFETKEGMMADDDIPRIS